MLDMMKERLLQLLQNNQKKFCVLGTSSLTGVPWCSVVSYAIKDTMTILLSTRKGTRKYQNIKENNKVSLVFGFDFLEPSIQTSGEARIIEKGDEYITCEDIFVLQNPYAKKFMTDETIFMVVKLDKVIISDFKKYPVQREEYSQQNEEELA